MEYYELFLKNADVKEENSMKGFSYVCVHGLAVVTGFEKNRKTIVIPSLLDGLSVSGIAAYAFRGKSYITDLRFPPTLRHIGAGAFEGCSGIVRLNFPESVEVVHQDAFRGCSSLAEVHGLGNLAFYQDKTSSDSGSQAIMGKWAARNRAERKMEPYLYEGAFADCPRLAKSRPDLLDPEVRLEWKRKLDGLDEMKRKREDELRRLINKAIDYRDYTNLKAVIDKEPSLLDKKGEMGYPLIHIAAINNDVPLLEHLLGWSVALGDLDKDGLLAIDHAVMRDYADVFKILWKAEGKPRRAVSGLMKRVISQYPTEDRTAIAHMLLDTLGSTTDAQLLVLALESEDEEMVKMLLDHFDGTLSESQLEAASHGWRGTDLWERLRALCPDADEKNFDYDFMVYPEATGQEDADGTPTAIGKRYHIEAEEVDTGPGLSWNYVLWFVKRKDGKWSWMVTDLDGCASWYVVTEGVGEYGLLAGAALENGTSEGLLAWARRHGEAELAQELEVLRKEYDL